jgi:hypothetical protein
VTSFPDVLTLAEAAAYLRVSETEKTDLMRRQGLPGRKIGSEWHFLKAGIQEWLQLPEKENVWWKQFGALKDDPSKEQLRPRCGGPELKQYRQWRLAGAESPTKLSACPRTSKACAAPT